MTDSYLFGERFLGIPSGEAFGVPTGPSNPTTLPTSGVFYGSSLLSGNLIYVGDIILSGTFTGLVTITLERVVRVISLDPVVFGVGDLFWSGPLPSYGEGFLSAFYEIIRVPRPVCPRPVVKTFAYNQTLGRGGLELRVSDVAGNPFAPISVLYSFYQVVRGGQRMLVGPPDRRPVPDLREGKVGRYYVTGTAGELGQPGDWICVWRFRRSSWTPEETVEEPFTVTSSTPQVCCRNRRKGWL
jgi:hypothetical protein